MEQSTKKIPTISAYMSSIRPYRWMALYERIKQIGVPFEMVILGPKNPDYELPPEIRFYRTDVKPAQCQHVAALLCEGKYLLQMVDDLSYTPGSIEAMIEVQEDADSKQKKVMSTAVYTQNGVNYRAQMNIHGHPRPDLPLLPVCGCYPRAAFAEVGGFDKRFTGAMGELDLYQRLSQAGYETIFVDGIVNEDLQYQNQENTSLCGKWWGIDRPLFLNIWNIHTGQRNDELQQYDNSNLDNLLSVNQ